MPTSSLATETATAKRAPPDVVAPAIGGVRVAFYHSDASAKPPSALRAVISWPGEVSQDVLVSDSVPPDDIPALRVARLVAFNDGVARP